MKYDYIIQNPPYLRSFHLEFLEKGLDILEKQGRMTIIEPATWLINVRKNGKAKLYDNIKAKLKNHVSKVVIENYNKEFNTNLYVPFSITYIDFSQEYEDIEFYCFGEKRAVKSLYDCNLIGSYDMIWNIFNKVLSYGDMMKNHIYDGKSNNEYYAAYKDIVGHGGISDNNNRYYLDSQYFGKYNLFLYHAYLQAISIKEEISSVPLHTIKAWPSNKDMPIYKNTIGDNITDSLEHLENWKYNVLNTKILPFIILSTSIDQHNNSKEFLPWLVDKQYTDEEINNLFHFTDEEISLMDKTIKKFERHSPWFKRYMCGKDSVSSEEVQKFIDNL